MALSHSWKNPPTVVSFLKPLRFVNAPFWAILKAPPTVVNLCKLSIFWSWGLPENCKWLPTEPSLLKALKFCNTVLFSIFTMPLILVILLNPFILWSKELFKMVKLVILVKALEKLIVVNAVLFPI